MKEQILKIAKDLKENTITEDEAKNLLFVLLMGRAPYRRDENNPEHKINVCNICDTPYRNVMHEKCPFCEGDKTYYDNYMEQLNKILPFKKEIQKQIAQIKLSKESMFKSEY